MKKIISIVVILALIVLVVIRLINNKEKTQSKVFQYDKQQAINVQVDTVKLENLDAEYSYTGSFEAFKESKISAEIQGKINSILVDVGSVVKKGQSLIQLDNVLLKLQLQTVEVQIEGYEADVKRYTVLAEADAIQGVTLEKSILLLKSAKVLQTSLLEQINKTTINAPFDGIVTAKFNDEGAIAVPAVPVLQITNITTLKFVINVPENDLVKFDLNKTYDVYSDIYPELLMSAKIIMIGSKADLSNTFPIQFLVENTSDFKIKSGMFGKLNLKNNDDQKYISIKSSALKGTIIEPQIYVVKNGKAVLQPITISERLKDKVIVSNGLNEGDVIIINGFINIFDGANVIYN